MPIFNMYIFNREGTCIYYKEWKREKQSGMPRIEEFKLMFGMIISLRSFSERLSTKDGQQCIRYYTTSTYKMNYMESPTGLKIVINSDPSAIGIPELIRGIYQIFADTVVKNVLISADEELKSDLFSNRVNQLVTSHSSF